MFQITSTGCIYSDFRYTKTFTNNITSGRRHES